MKTKIQFSLGNIYKSHLRKTNLRGSHLCFQGNLLRENEENKIDDTAHDCQEL